MEKTIIVNGQENKIKIISQNAEQIVFEFAGAEYSYQRMADIADFIFLKRGDKLIKATTSVLGNGETRIAINENEATVGLKSRKSSTQAAAGELKSPMPGKIFKIMAKVSQKVTVGEPLLIVEAMKMEHTIKANQDGIIKKINYKEGEQVDAGALLVQIEE
ncbi:MAG: hypothetical protein JNM93_13325 [Bacteriovoracaceae bacterium]|nr:hypothetical protein [Bacteriovoracaceae bacterium]